MLNVRERRAAKDRADLEALIHDFGLGRAAALLEVYETTVERWLAGKTRVPKAALLALRGAAWGQLPGMEGRDWEGWYVGTDGLLHSPDGRAWGPKDLYAVHWEKQLIESLRRRAAELEDQVAALARPPAAGVPLAANDAA